MQRKVARISRKFFVSLALVLVLVGACGTPVQTPPPTVGKNSLALSRTATPIPASDEEAIRQLVNAECEAVVQQDVDRLQDIWDPNGKVIDANHTEGDPNDDVSWSGWDAVRDRYVNIIFPSNPTFCEHPNVLVTINGAKANATSSVKIGTTNCNSCDHWTFTKGGNGWKITSLVYNLEPH